MQQLCKLWFLHFATAGDKHIDFRFLAIASNRELNNDWAINLLLGESEYLFA